MLADVTLLSAERYAVSAASTPSEHPINDCKICPTLIASTSNSNSAP
jgi:hypothetical protein